MFCSRARELIGVARQDGLQHRMSYELVCCHCVTWVSDGRAEPASDTIICATSVSKLSKNVNTLQQCEGCLGKCMKQYHDSMS